MPRRIVFVASAADAPSARPGTAVVVLDPGWTPVPGGRPDLAPVRALLGPVIEDVDVIDEALDRLDRWADEVGLADRLIVEGVSYWFRLREPMWLWLEERLQWVHALGRIAAGPGSLHVDAPEAEGAIRDAAAALGCGSSPVASRPQPSIAGERTATTTPGLRVRLGRLVARIGSAWTARRRADGSEGRRASRHRVLDERLRRFRASPGPGIVVLTMPATHQVIDGVRRDPNLAAVVDRLATSGARVIELGLGLSADREEDWPRIEADGAMLPASELRRRWGSADDGRRGADAVDAAERALRDLPASDALRVGSAWLQPAALDHLGSVATEVVRTDAQQRARAERLLADLRPAAVVLTHEGIRLPWLAACRAAGIPSFTVQHGVLYRRHAGYPNRRHRALVLPTCTFVFGSYERRVLVEDLAFEPSEVEVTGSPRVDLVTPRDDAGVAATDARAAVRRALMVRDGDRMLVVSTLHVPSFRRSYLANMLERVLGGPLPGVHIVFKQHPGERDVGYYRELLEGLAAAGGYPPPPMTVVRDIDLHELLRAADAHLGLMSTVLTDAVAAGTRNLIAIVDAHADLLGYVEAGVARPVHDPASLLESLAAPPADPSRRAAFLEDHFRPGDAAARIANRILAEVRVPAAPPSGR